MAGFRVVGWGEEREFGYPDELEAGRRLEDFSCNGFVDQGCSQLAESRAAALEDVGTCPVMTGVDGCDATYCVMYKMVLQQDDIALIEL